MDEQSVLEEQLRRAADQFRNGTDDLRRRRRAWDAFQDLAREWYSALVKAGAEAELFEFLYIDPAVAPRDRELSTLQHITLLWGRHPIGIVPRGKSLVVEGGCALHAGQDYRGGVAFLLYPFDSELHPSREEHIVLWFFKDPRHITPRHLRRFIRQFLAYAQVTSAFGKPTVWEKLTVHWLRAASHVKQLGLWESVKFVIKTAPKSVSAVKGVMAVLGGS